MTSYDQIEDEDELQVMLSKTENFEDRKKIRARIRDIRDKKMKEMEEKRLENEKIAGNVLKEKVKRADEEKERKMQAYKEMSNITAVSEDQRLKSSQDVLKDRQRQADEDKRRTLELFDQMAKKDTKTLSGGDQKDGAVAKAKEDDDKPKETTETTTVTSKDGKTTTVTTVQTITDKNETRIITTEVATKTMPDGGTSTKTSKRTKIIQNQTSFGGAMAAPGGLTPGRGRGITRSPSAIKQMLLEWTKAMTQEYSDKIVITNFSSSWNNGLAFCALIHHFYPDAFDFDALDPKKRRHNFNLAFDTAEKLADIAPLLDTDDMVRMKNPDWKCVFTYVQSFYRKLQSHGRNKAMPRPEKTES